MVDFEYNQLLEDCYDGVTDEELNKYPIELAEFIVKLYD